MLNGTDTTGLAGRNATVLRAAGFTVDTVDSTATAAAQTLIQYPAGMQAQAKAVAAAVPQAKLTLTSSVARVTLILGSDGIQAKGAAVSSVTAGASTSPAAGTSTARPAPSAPNCIN